MNQYKLWKTLLVLLLLASEKGFASADSNTIKPETTPPPAEGALALKDLPPVYSRDWPEQPKVSS